MDRDEPNPLLGIALKVSSVLVFVAMSTFIKSAGDGIATGQITFYRSAFAMVPILGYLAIRGDLATAFRTRDPFGHLVCPRPSPSAMPCRFWPSSSPPCS